MDSPATNIGGIKVFQTGESLETRLQNIRYKLFR